VKQPIVSHIYENGLVLVAEPMESLASAAFTVLLPAGCAYDPSARSGLATFTCEMALRGCGPRDSRQFVQELDNLGVERGESVSASHTSFSGATLSQNIVPTLEIYADLLRRPHFPDDQLDPARQVVLQELRSIEDEPGQKVMLELRRHCYGEPWGRPSYGDLAALEAISLAEIRKCFATHYRPNGTIIGVAGRIDWPRLRDEVGRLLGDWKPLPAPPIADVRALPRRAHLDFESNQTQVGIAYDSVPYRHPDYFQASGAVGVLSGGMSARLFSEVREKRGLCYSVYASYHTLRDRGSVLCYAGTSADRAQETLDVTLGELTRLAEGIQPQELARLKARVKSGLIMQQESSSSRSSTVARDWYHLGRVRTLDEVSALVDALSCESINAYLAEHPPHNFTIVTLGPNALEVPVGIS
jgi:predicted Zn-dependent peptidase